MTSESDKLTLFSANRYGVQSKIGSERIGLGNVGARLQKGTLRTVPVAALSHQRPCKSATDEWSLYGPGKYIDTTKEYEVEVKGEWKDAQGEPCVGTGCTLTVGLELKQGSKSLASLVSGYKEMEPRKMLFERRAGTECSFDPKEGSTFWLDSCRDYFRHYTTCWSDATTSNPNCEAVINQGSLGNSVFSHVRFH